MPTKINKNVYGQISIHTLCEEGDDEGQCSAIFFDISIHTLCEEGDDDFIFTHCWRGGFQSTPSVKRATGKGNGKTYSVIISIHTLCEEGDY